jgi:hypothetical protein
LKVFNPTRAVSVTLDSSFLSVFICVHPWLNDFEQKSRPLKIMKRWALLTVFLYVLALLLLTAPVTLVAFGNWGLKADPDWIKDALSIYTNCLYWIWLVVLMAGQLLLLLVPIDISERRLPTRRKLKVPIIVTAFFLSNLVFAAIISVLLAGFRDHAFDYFDLTLIFRHPAAHADSGDGVVATMIFTVVFFWLAWALLFYRATKTDSPNTLLKRAKRWLLRGSILELIIAVPSHVIVRRRDDCCAPAGTFWGIATGISVMLLCFGPGVFFLFAERCRKLKPQPENEKKIL